MSMCICQYRVNKLSSIKQNYNTRIIYVNSDILINIYLPNALYESDLALIMLASDYVLFAVNRLSNTIDCNLTKQKTILLW